MKKLKIWLSDNILTIALLFAVIVWTNRLTTIYENRITEIQLHPMYEQSINDWVGFVKKYGDWNEETQKRFDAIENIRIIPHEQMKVVGVDSISGIKLRAVGTTSYKVVDGELLPKEITFSSLTLHNDVYYRNIVIYHELGHAVLFQDDIYEDYDHQIMWYSTHDSYCEFQDVKFYARKLTEQLQTPKSDEMITRLTNGIDGEMSLEHACGFGAFNNK